MKSLHESTSMSSLNREPYCTRCIKTCFLNYKHEVGKCTTVLNVPNIVTDHDIDLNSNEMYQFSAKIMT